MFQSRLPSLFTYAIVLSLTGCVGSSGSNGCQAGSEGCACYGNRSCDEPLACRSNLCVEVGDAGATDSDDESTESDDGAATDEQEDAADASVAATDAETDDATASTSNDESSKRDASTADPTEATSTTDASDTTTDDTTDDPAVDPATDDPNAAPTDAMVTDEATTDTTMTDVAVTDVVDVVPEPSAALVPVDGWVARETNTVGIEGAFYTYSDGVSAYEPDTSPFFEGAGPDICLAGSAPPHLNADASWGVAVGFDMNLVDEIASAYDATAYGVVGFSFTLRGDNPPRVQINVREYETAPTFCRRYTDVSASVETFTVYFDQLDEDCWEGINTAGPDPSNLLSFGIQAISAASDYVYFDFCVEDIRAIVE